MESDINYPKSKAFNVFLRFLQLALSLACTVFLIEFVEHSCADSQYRILEILIGSIGAVSIIALMIIKCSSSHPKAGFFLLFLVEFAAVVAIGFFSFQNVKAGNCGFT